MKRNRKHKKSIVLKKEQVYKTKSIQLLNKKSLK